MSLSRRSAIASMVSIVLSGSAKGEVVILPSNVTLPDTLTIHYRESQVTLTAKDILEALEQPKPSTLL
jgi:hypothetical protein